MPVLLALPRTLQQCSTQRQYNGLSRILHYTYILLFGVNYILLELKHLAFKWRLKFLSYVYCKCQRLAHQLTSHQWPLFLWPVSGQRTRPGGASCLEPVPCSGSTAAVSTSPKQEFHAKEVRKEKMGISCIYCDNLNKFISHKLVMWCSYYLGSSFCTWSRGGHDTRHWFLKERGETLGRLQFKRYSVLLHIWIG